MDYLTKVILNCTKVAYDDISSKILIEHQKHIIGNNCAGLIQYYTIQGSYFMNQYMRGQTKYIYKNDTLENNIRMVWNLILDAPEFDNDYVFYRFIHNDSHLAHLKAGDIYVENGFTSTTRDPFYRDDTYNFGFVLIKIHIPKNTRSVALSLELLSHFPQEEEIIFPPLANFKLTNKNEKCYFFHLSAEYAAQIKT